RVLDSLWSSKPAAGAALTAHPERRAVSASRHHSLDERHLEHLLVGDGPMAEVATLAEQLPVVGGDHDPGVSGHHLEEPGEDPVQVLDGLHLARTKAGKLALTEERRRLLLAPFTMILSELPHDSMYTRNVRPLAG